MILIGLDFESTGLDIVNDRPIELGLALWTTKFNRSLDTRAFLIQSDGVKVTDEITEITGINQAMCDKYGYTPEEAYDEAMYFIDRAEAIVAFNGVRFDVPVMRQLAKRLGKTLDEKLVIDPFTDLPMRGQELITMCAKKGISYDPHEAGADVGAMLRLMAKFPFEVVLERAKSPMLVVRSMQDRKNNKAAKKHKFRWNPDLQIWWKAVKEIDLNDLAAKVNNEFGLEVLDLNPADLEDNE
jgi:DNA polymerase III alpha subunit (gram-positive type)